MPHKQGKRKGARKASWDPVIKGYTGAADSMSASKIFYDGPVSIPRQSLQEHVVVTSQFFEGVFSSTAAGVIANVYTNDPTNTVEWSSISSVFDEFRVLGFDIEYFPLNRYSKTTTVCTPGVGVIDHNTVTALGSLTAGFQHESCRVLSLEDPWTSRKDFAGNKAPPLKWRMAAAEEAVFTSTSGTLSNSSIKFYFSGLTVSTQYGIVLLRFIVQFRGRA